LARAGSFLLMGRYEADPVPPQIGRMFRTKSELAPGHAGGSPLAASRQRRSVTRRRVRCERRPA
jgi:hypothetical protein